MHNYYKCYLYSSQRIYSLAYSVACFHDTANNAGRTVNIKDEMFFIQLTVGAIRQ